MPKIFLIRQELELQHQQLSGSIKNQDQPAVFSWDILGERKSKSCDDKLQPQPQPEDRSRSSRDYEEREDTKPALGEFRDSQ